MAIEKSSMEITGKPLSVQKKTRGRLPKVKNALVAEEGEEEYDLGDGVPNATSESTAAASKRRLCLETTSSPTCKKRSRKLGHHTLKQDENCEGSSESEDEPIGQWTAGSCRLTGGRRHVFGEDAVGSIIDVTYSDEEGGPPQKFRMQVMGFEAHSGWHHTNSAGLSFWEGESFTDEIDLTKMYESGQIEFVSTTLKVPKKKPKVRA